MATTRESSDQPDAASAGAYVAGVARPRLPPLCGGCRHLCRRNQAAAESAALPSERGVHPAISAALHLLQLGGGRGSRSPSAAGCGVVCDLPGDDVAAAV